MVQYKKMFHILYLNIFKHSYFWGYVKAVIQVYNLQFLKHINLFTLRSSQSPGWIIDD